MTERNGSTPPPPPTASPAHDLGDLLRLHFEASRIEFARFLDEWASNALRSTVTVAVSVVLGGIGGIFMLIAAALAIGDALHHLGWGLLIVGGALAAAGGGFAFAHFILDKNQTDQESV